MMNTGLITPKIRNNKDWFAGGITGIPSFSVLEPSLDYSPYLPVYEQQSNRNFDSMACVTFANLNVNEILIKRMVLKGLITNKEIRQKLGGDPNDDSEINFSDRFTAVASGTRRTGNTMASVAESIRMQGAVLQHIYPNEFDRIVTWKEWHKPLPDILYTKAKLFNTVFDYHWDWVGSRLPRAEIINKALATSPLTVSVQIYSPQNDKGYYVNRSKLADYGHLVTCYGFDGEAYLIYDHYNHKYKKYDKSYVFGHAMRHWLTLKEQTMPQENPLNLKDYTLVRVVTANAILLSFYMKGKMYYEPGVEGELKAYNEWHARNAGNNGFSGGPVRTIDEQKWDLYQRVNYSNEIIHNPK